MISKKDRDKAMNLIRDYYDKNPSDRTIDASFFVARCGFDSVYAEQVVRVLADMGLITYEPDPGDKTPTIRLTSEGRTYAETQADISAAASKSTRQFVISTVIAVAALIIALFDWLCGIPR